LAPLRLRDRDAIITHEGLIFRVLGYMHLPEGYICDLEYAPSEIYKSSNPKAVRSDGRRVFYKFYGDEGWSFLSEKYPHYIMDCRFLGRKIIGVRHMAIKEIRRPEERLQKIIELSPSDSLIHALQKLVAIIIADQGLSLKDFGVFGSILHGFHNPNFSDLDMTVYSRDCLEKLRSILSELYARPSSPLTNEFTDESSIRGKVWRFKGINPREFLWHQRRKLIYAVFYDDCLRRRIKAEFEPVKAWREIVDERQDILRIRRVGWTRSILRVTDDKDGPFIPSIYYVEPIEVIEGLRRADILRVVSYVEEFRMQCFKDEVIYAEGNLEEVETGRGSFHQITLTYGPRYYEQTLKTLKPV